jgi:hypothetical protein
MPLKIKFHILAFAISKKSCRSLDGLSNDAQYGPLFLKTRGLRGMRSVPRSQPTDPEFTILKPKAKPRI